MIDRKLEDFLNVCSTGDLNAVKSCFDSLNKNEIESILDNHKASCLHYAARVGSLEVIQYLIQIKQVSPFLVSEIGATILHDAAVKGKIQVIEWLIKNTELNLGVKDANGATLVHIAAKFDQIDLIDWIVDYEGIRSIKEQMYNGATCLHFACSTNSIRSMKKILKTVPNLINIQMMNGVTALYLATQENNLAIVRILTKQGANVKLKATDGMTPFHVACQNGSFELVHYYLEEFKVNINEKDFNGVTCLHFACINGNERIVSILLSNGAKILADKNGSTPLHDCASGGHIECARLLVSNHCDVSLKDNHNMSALDIARINGHLKFYEEFKKFIKPLQDLEGSGIIRLNIQDNRSYKRTLEKVTVSMVNLKDKRNDLSTSTKEATIISPIFNSQAVVSTSTPSVMEHELSIQKTNKHDENTSYRSLTNQVSSNQCFIKIVSDSDKTKKRASKLNEIDKCIAEFEKYKNLNEIKPVALDEINNLVNQNEIVTSKSASHHYHQSSLPNRLLSDLITGVPPPPPPPLPSTWSSKSSIKPSLKNEIESNGIKLRHVNQDKKTKPLSTSISYIDELQNQIKNGGINLLNNNNKNTIKNDENKSVTLDSNNNCDSIINANRISFRPPVLPQEQSDNTDELKVAIKQISDLRLNASNKSTTSLHDMPEWKRKLIEKKRQQQQLIN